MKNSNAQVFDGRAQNIPANVHAIRIDHRVLSRYFIWNHNKSQRVGVASAVSMALHINAD
jgi:hypothetical protein